jgi:inorganic pyrophosphatase
MKATSLLASKVTRLRLARFKTPGDLPDVMLDQLERFFVTYHDLEQRVFKALGVEGGVATG